MAKELNWKPTMGRKAPDYTATLKNSAQSKGVVGRASDENTGQRVPQRKPYKYMSGEEMLGALARKASRRK